MNSGSIWFVKLAPDSPKKTECLSEFCFRFISECKNTEFFTVTDYIPIAIGVVIIKDILFLP